MQVLLLGLRHANSHNCRLSLTESDVRKQDSRLYLTQIELLHSPSWQTLNVYDLLLLIHSLSLKINCISLGLKIVRPTGGGFKVGSVLLEIK